MRKKRKENNLKKESSPCYNVKFFLEIILLLDEEEFLLYRTKFFQFIVQSRVEKGNCIMITLQTEKLGPI